VSGYQSFGELSPSSVSSGALIFQLNYFMHLLHEAHKVKTPIKELIIFRTL
jgi:hypothetical protein